ncbi:LysR family transcriptional regulator [Pseudogemmobacter bohemicus]|uniref:LysR family transcriptional regulator n=1 Tax=Pseudogemmobacter bohemicus TaxID=2250708 RepID=UPI000DD2EDC9|nr:LysR family transcriptional regulator [Pseudogemmobacter bohemicus]
MEIHQLRSFVAVAREGSITRASERLCLSQPAVSAHIRAIEERLGLVLFHRLPRGMVLTGEGALLLDEAEAVLMAQRAFLTAAQRLSGRPGGRLRIGGGGNSPLAAPGRLLQALTGQYPEIEVTLQDADSGAVLAGLRDGSLDAGFLNESGQDRADLDCLVVARFRIWLAAPKGMIERPGDPDWQTLAGLPWILPGKAPSCCGHAAENLFLRHQFRPRQRVAIDRESATRALIAGGTGLGLLHEWTAFDARDRGEVELICEAGQAVDVLFATLASRADEPLIAIARDLCAGLTAPEFTVPGLTDPEN